MSLFQKVYKTLVYYNYYRGQMRAHWDEYIKRVCTTYIISLAVVAVILMIIQQADWGELWGVALKKVIIVGFPASLSAAVADVIK